MIFVIILIVDAPKLNDMNYFDVVLKPGNSGHDQVVLGVVNHVHVRSWQTGQSVY